VLEHGVSPVAVSNEPSLWLGLQRYSEKRFPGLGYAISPRLLTVRTLHLKA
jgi:hypothetical protein